MFLWSNRYLLQGSCKVLRTQRRTLLYSSKKGVSRNFLAFVQQPIDLSPSSLQKWYKRRQLELLKEQQKYNPKRHETLGPDLATAHFVVARGGKVKFVGMERWIEKDDDQKYNLPKFYVESMFLEAIDCSGGYTMYESLDNFINLKHLKYLNLSDCSYVDDWCLDRIHQFAESLVYLDLSRCPNITEKGLACLHKLKNIRHLVVKDLPKVKHKPLVGILLEEMLPDCRIEGLTYLDMEDYHWEPVAEIPQYLKRLDQFSTDSTSKETSIAQ